MAPFVKAFHEPAGILYHGGALLYALAAYGLGWWGLFAGNWWVWAGSVLLLGHGMVIAAYLIHECGHNTIFRNNEANARLGRFLNWICGSSYGTFEDIRYKHFRHHVDNDDSVWFVYEEYLARHPLQTRAIRFLEWFLVPAHEVLMHGIMMFSAFIIPQRKGQRLRQSVVILLRVGAFIALLALWPRVAIGYVLAYMLMMHVLRFMDMLQHDYGNNPILYEENAPSRFGGRATEQAHTFSNPISFGRDLPNWLVLNFGFHNAHHLRPTVPWYRLPAFYREHVSNDPDSVVPFAVQLKIYFSHRVRRVTHRGGPHDEVQGAVREEYLETARRGLQYGGNAASFLTSF
jgi:fatty acid desaturase